MSGFVAVSGCVAPNPKFCDALEDCANGLVCNLETNSCVPPPAPPDVECSDQIPCADPLKPICNPDQVCQSCALDDECGSQVCKTDGSCELAENILYAAPDGVVGGLCPAETPCDLSFAWSLLDATRATIRLANGTYGLATDLETSDSPVTVVGGRGAILVRSDDGPAFEALSSALTLRGFVLNKGVSCTSGPLSISGVVFDNPTTELRPWIAGGCPIEVTGSELHDSNTDGISYTAGPSLIVKATTIDGSAANGIRCVNTTCEILDARINENQLIGISVINTTLTVSRSSLTENRQGGISFESGRYDITNNMVFRNGNSADSVFGGIRLEAPSGTSRVEHNTIVFNDRAVGTTPVKAGGLFCVGALARNNLIYNNFEGNNSQPNAQTNNTCNTTGSLVLNGNGTNEMHFVRPLALPFDYHIADSGSPAVNAGAPGEVSDDFDQDPRSDGLPDIGADELAP